MEDRTHNQEDDNDLPAFQESYAADAKNDARYNLAVVGLTGAGKSTLVNAAFEENLAQTGTGRPVTRGVNFYVNAASTLGLYDFEGIETGQDLAFVSTRFRDEFTKRLTGEKDSMIHGVWYCVRSTDLRFDDGQAEIVSNFASLDVPIILVLTRVPKRPDLGVDPRVRELAESIRQRGLPIVTGRPILINAEADDFSGQPAHGLDRLIELTYDTAPEGVKAALAAAQRVSVDKKRTTAHQVIAAATAAAGLAGLAPAPGADSLAIIPIQAAMMRKIARVYQIDVQASTVASAIATMAVRHAGTTAYRALLRLVPGWGTVAAGVVAATFTAALGESWHRMCIGLADGTIDASMLFDSEGLGVELLRVLEEQLGKLRL